MKTHMDLNWFNGSEEELAQRFNVGSGVYTPPASAVVEGETADTEEEVDVDLEGKKVAFEMAKQVDLNYRGDYQEAAQETKRYFANGRRPGRHSPSMMQPAAHARMSAEERQWIRSYFISKAVRQAE